MTSDLKPRLIIPKRNWINPFYGLDHFLIFFVIWLACVTGALLAQHFDLLGIFPRTSSSLKFAPFVGGTFGLFIASVMMSKAELYVPFVLGQRPSKNELLTEILGFWGRLKYDVPAIGTCPPLHLSYKYANWERLFFVREWYVTIDIDEERKLIIVTGPGALCRTLSRSLKRRIRAADQGI